MAMNPLKPRHIRVHPELQTELYKRTRIDGGSMEDVLHRILCRTFNRPDLENAGVDPTLKRAREAASA